MPDPGVDLAIIGAGVVGAAAFARLSRPGRSVLLLERRPKIGGEITERNSGVVHAGLWYPPASLKTRLSVEGNRLLYAFAQRHGVPHARLGKLVVATTEEEEAALHEVRRHGTNVGVPGLALKTQAELAKLEPDATGRAALWVPSTGIVDPYELTAALVAQGTAAGGEVITSAALEGAERDGEGWLLRTGRGPIRAAAVVNAAGLYADVVSRLFGVDAYVIHPCRGDYYTLRSARRFTHLIYPVKKKGAPGLGIHLTLDLGGRMRLGPDATYVDAKDDYAGGGGKELEFAAAASRILGPIAPADVRYESSGIRPKLRARHEAEEKDFVVSRDAPGLINLMGIESPGLTSALAIAALVESLL